MWRRYVELERIDQLPNSGRELLGRDIVFTVKRDGENVSVWLKPQSQYENLPRPPIFDIHISSHNQEKASPEIVSRFRATPEFDRITRFLQDEWSNYGHRYIAYGELLKPVSPTRIEPKRKNIHCILFDIWDVDTKRFLPYTIVYQVGKHWKIPVVESLIQFVPKSMPDLGIEVERFLAWCRRHRREGIVLKVYDGEQIFAKEKIDLPDIPRLERKSSQKVQYPLMPLETQLRALHLVFNDAAATERWKDKRIAMSVLAKHIAIEGREHNYSTPRDIYSLYLGSLENREDRGIPIEAGYVPNP